ncbi:DsbA family protein [Deinococcus sp. QL22]|uniref:DsbA family protein n=1 Tax=Deinococcus sp. QL22 TaxID=2939437 RepID=UPI002017F515|nr:DsbA family protein [Deinococcus sp. QL22]UQN07932.1 DsbA family protein [Deinococcus sp. QL22]
MKFRLFPSLLVLTTIGGAFSAGLLLTKRSEPFRPINITGQPTLGEADAPVQVVVFEDFKCPFCARYEHDVFPQLKSRYIDTGKVRYSFVNLAFLGPDSITAAQAGECVNKQESRLFWDFVEKVYHHQGNETTIWATPDSLGELAATIPGIEVSELRSCLLQHTFAQDVTADQKLAEHHDVRGTPEIYVNGIRVTAKTTEGISNMIELALQSSYR